MYLIVKGTEQQARAEVARRGGKSFAVTFTRELTTAGNADMPEEAVVKWFCEPFGEAPYPIGTLLWYSQGREGLGAAAVATGLDYMPRGS